ncbi:hypothetical protein A6R68_18526, partial [Neotoma lepida]
LPEDLNEEAVHAYVSSRFTKARQVHLHLVSCQSFEKSHISSRYSQKQHSPCTAWRHHLDREDSLSIAAATPEMIIHSLWRPLRHRE